MAYYRNSEISLNIVSPLFSPDAFCKIMFELYLSNYGPEDTFITKKCVLLTLFLQNITIKAARHKIKLVCTAKLKSAKVDLFSSYIKCCYMRQCFSQQISGQSPHFVAYP